VCQPETFTLVEQDIQDAPFIFLVDGHHRLHALTTLKKPFIAWVVPFKQLSIGSFIKVFTPPMPQCFF
jgi:hypothetical protein